MKKEHNIFTYAKKELGQDAFIALLCALHDSENTSEKELSQNFIKFLFQNDKVPEYDKLEIKTQYCNIDVLLTFYHNEEPIMYLIIEDKTDSEEHDGQIQKYINKIRYGEKYKEGKKTNELVGLDKISVVYYKTGHLLKSDSNLTDTYDSKNNNLEERQTRWRFVPKDSEQKRLTNITEKNKDLYSFKILELPGIYWFFYNHEGTIHNSQNDILIAYLENLESQHSAYCADKLPINEPTAAIWAKVFDEFVKKYTEEHQNSDMKFEVNKYSGDYWEVRISSSINMGEKEASTNPVMLYNSRDTNTIRFVNKENTNPDIQVKFTQNPDKNKSHNDNIFSYKLNINSETITTDLIKKLLNAICDNYEKILSGTTNEKFMINIKEGENVTVFEKNSKCIR